MTEVAQPDVDGRAARRHRNTDAVLDAVHALFVEGQLEPTVEDVAARSGVSLRSIYRYFPDRHGLLQAALQRRMTVAESLFHLDAIGQGPLDERIERFARHRVELHAAMAPTARAALSVASSAAVIAEVVQQRRQQLTEQARVHFRSELETLSREEAADVLAAIDLLSQFESVEALRVGRRLSPTRTHRVLVTGLRALLGSPATPG